MKNFSCPEAEHLRLRSCLLPTLINKLRTQTPTAIVVLNDKKILLPLASCLLPLAYPKRLIYNSNTIAIYDYLLKLASSI
jgi:hypothetical protein